MKIFIPVVLISYGIFKSSSIWLAHIFLLFVFTGCTFLTYLDVPTGNKLKHPDSNVSTFHAVHHLHYHVDSHLPQSPPVLILRTPVRGVTPSLGIHLISLPAAWDLPPPPLDGWDLPPPPPDEWSLATRRGHTASCMLEWRGMYH